MSWKKLSSEVLVRITTVIIIDTTVLAANLQFFSDCFFLGTIIFLIWIYILTKGPCHVFFLFALMWANRAGPSRCHMNHHIEEACSDVLVLATLKKEAFILFSCYFSIYLQISGLFYSHFQAQFLFLCPHCAEWKLRFSESLFNHSKKSTFFFYDYCLSLVHVLKQIWVCAGDMCDLLGACVTKCLKTLCKKNAQTIEK